jgi:hypothetical protein
VKFGLIFLISSDCDEDADRGPGGNPVKDEFLPPGKPVDIARE